METTHIKNIEYQYLGEKSNFFSAPSCRAQPKKSGLRPNHLGNVHLVLSDRKQTSTYDNILAAYEYYPFGMAMQTYETDVYRYGFNGMEKDDEWNSSGNSYDFGARIYDARLGRFLSIDPKTALYPHLSSYLYANNSPVYYVDEKGESGKAYKTKEVNASTGRPILKVVSNVYLYGNAATEARRASLSVELNNNYNNRAGNLFTYTDESGITYDVKFEFKVEIRKKENLENDIRVAKVEDNFVLVANELKGKSSGTGTLGDPSENNGGNIAKYNPDELDENIGTASHEMNHGFGGKDHPETEVTDYNPGDPVDISVPKYSTYKDGTPINYKDRVVTQDNIKYILDNVTFDDKGEGDVGSNTAGYKYKPTTTGYEKFE